jgi:hypothetical protein
VLEKFIEPQRPGTDHTLPCEAALRRINGPGFGVSPTKSTSRKSAVPLG